jgi:PAS domain S-box-containing protein
LDRSPDLANIRTLAEDLAQIVVSAGASGRALYTNPEWTRFTGLTPEQSMGLGWQLAVHPSDLDPSLERYAEGDRTGLPFTMSARLRSVYGDYHVFSIVVFPLRDSENRRLFVSVCSQTDVYEMADDRFRRLADALPLLVWTTDRDDRLTFVNRAWYEYTGLAAGTLLEDRNALVHPDDLGRLMRALRTGGNEVRFRLRRRKDGMFRWFLLRWVRLSTTTGAPFFRVGTAIDIHDEVMGAEDRERHIRSIAEAIPDIVWSVRPDGVQDYVSSAMVQFTGLPVDQLLDGRWRRALNAEDAPAALAAWKRSFMSGEPYEHKFRLRRADGAYRWFLTRATPLRSPDGSLVRWFGTCTDIDDQIRTTAEQAYLAQLGELINNSLDLETTLRSIADSAVPALADCCRIDLDENDELHTRAIAYRDDGVRERMDRGNDPHETVLFPLVARRGKIGTIAFVREGRWGGDPSAAVPFLEEVARRAAFAIQNAQLYEHEHRVAQTLQSASLPKTLPRVVGLALDAIYVPGQSEAQIGGDWYDAFALDDGRIVLSIGDVAGSGLDAAVTMSNMRQIIRGTAQVHADPVLMLDAADRALRLEDPDRFVTAFVGVFDRVTRTMTYASAGHPPPFVRGEDGTLRELLFIDLPLGLRDRNHETQSRSVTLAHGDLLVFYTDGLVESAKDLDRGVARLRETLADPDLEETLRPAVYLRERMLPDGAHDDVAILTVRVLRDETQRYDVLRWRFEVPDETAMYDTRAALRAALAKRRFDDKHVQTAELVLGELISNVVRHAPGPLEIILDSTSEHVVLHVIDEGPGFERPPMLPLDVLSESGRGLYIVSQLTREFSATRRAPRGSHARAVLLRGRV